MEEIGNLSCDQLLLMDIQIFLNNPVSNEDFVKLRKSGIKFCNFFKKYLRSRKNFK